MSISNASAQPAQPASTTQVPPPSTAPASTAMASLSAPTVELPQPVAAITVQMPSTPKGEWWEGVGVLPATAAVIAVVITVVSAQIITWLQIRAAKASTQKQIEAAAIQTEKQLAHAREQAFEDRDAAASQAREERAHSADEAKRDRLVEARKAIYGDLIDDYRKVQELIGNLPNVDPTDPSFAQPLMAMSASVNKLWIWGEVDSVQKVRELLSQSNEFFIDALPHCAPIHQFKNKIALREVLVEKCEAERNEVLQQLREFDRDVPPQARTLPEHANKDQQLRKELKTLVERLSLARTDIAGLSQQSANAVAAYSAFVVERQALMMDQINKVMAAARAEVGLNDDISILEKQSAEMTLRAKAALKILKNGLAR